MIDERGIDAALDCLHSEINEVSKTLGRAKRNKFFPRESNLGLSCHRVKSKTKGESKRERGGGEVPRVRSCELSQSMKHNLTHLR